RLGMGNMEIVQGFAIHCTTWTFSCYVFHPSLLFEMMNKELLRFSRQNFHDAKISVFYLVDFTMAVFVVSSAISDMVS
uniref:Uncharacterized protein n=1 Tax=Aegilops tauschii subsp. strangulata TaxID=200361 RepID=A0A453JII3_AEGTS